MSDLPPESEWRRSRRIVGQSPASLPAPPQESSQHLPTSQSSIQNSSHPSASDSQASFHSVSSAPPRYSSHEIPFGSPPFFPHLSPASPSQFSSPNRTAPSAFPLNLFRPSAMIYSAPEGTQDPESLSINTSGEKFDTASARSVNVSLSAPSFINAPHTNNPRHPAPQPYHRYSTHYYGHGPIQSSML